MKKFIKKILLPILLITLSLSATAFSFGSYPVEESKFSSSLNTTFSLGLLNPNQDNITVLISTEESTQFNTSLPKTVVIPPSPATTNPEGSGYYYIGDGKYAKITKANFKISTHIYRDSNTIHVPVTVEAFPQETTGSDVRQLRDHIFTFNVDPSMTPIDPPTKNNDSTTLNFSESRKEDSNKKTSRKQNNSVENTVRNQTNGSKTYKAEENQTENQGGLNTTTMILIAGILGSTYYIYRVV